MLRLISNARILYKLAVPLTAAVFAVFVTFVAAHYWLGSVDRSIEAIVDQDSARLELALKISDDLLVGALIVRDVRLASDIGVVDRLTARDHELEARVQSEFAALLPLMVGPEQRHTVEEANTAFHAFAAALADRIARERESLPGGHHAASTGGTGRLARAKVDELLRQIVADSEADMRVSRDAALAVGRRSEALVVLASSIVRLLALGFLVWIVVVEISRPLRRMAQLMGRLAAGDLSVSVTDAERRDEIGALARAFQAFKENALALHAMQRELQSAKEAAETANRATQAANAALEQRVAERTSALKTAQEELIRSERLAILGQVTATVAHDLRNPLSAIRNTLFTAREMAAAQGATLDRPFDRMARGLQRCETIIAELLDHTRLRELRCEQAAFDAWLGEVIDEQTPPHGIALTKELGAGDACVNLDRDRFRRVMVNLIENATQAIAGAIAEPVEHEAGGRITLTTRLAFERLELVVADSGPGIPAQILGKVFEPLFSTKSFGTGLGLPMVKQIVEQHGGRIRIESEPGAGTRVIVELPLSHGQQAAA